MLATARHGVNDTSMANYATPPVTRTPRSEPGSPASPSLAPASGGSGGRRGCLIGRVARAAAIATAVAQVVALTSPNPGITTATDRTAADGGEVAAHGGDHARCRRRACAKALELGIKQPETADALTLGPRESPCGKGTGAPGRIGLGSLRTSRLGHGQTDEIMPIGHNFANIPTILWDRLARAGGHARLPILLHQHLDHGRRLERGYDKTRGAAISAASG